MTDNDERARMARRQAELLHALLANGPTPAGFDPVRLKAQSRMLTAKRRAVIRRNSPDLADQLGDRFAALCEQYCGECPLISGEEPSSDVAQFRHWLAVRGEIPTPSRRGRLLPGRRTKPRTS